MEGRPESGLIMKQSKRGLQKGEAMKTNVVLKSLIVVLVIGLAGFLTSCSSSSSKENSVKIVSISPDINTPLQAGSSVEISVDVEYSLKQNKGEITLVLQQGDATPTISLGNVDKPIKKGSGKLTLKANITIPKTDSIQVFTALSIPGESQTTTVDMRVLKVVGN